MKLALIYMASGFGRRFGENKLLVDFDGLPLYLHTLLKMLEVKREIEQKELQLQILVVSQYGQILEKAENLGLQGIPNDKSEEGITASLKLGTSYAGEDTDIFVYFVADQPYLKKETIKSFLLEFIESKKGIGAVSSNAKRGNPVAFRKKYRQRLLALSGDRGGSVIVRENLEDLWLKEVEVEELRDIDTPAHM